MRFGILHGTQHGLNRMGAAWIHTLAYVFPCHAIAPTHHRTPPHVQACVCSTATATATTTHGNGIGIANSRAGVEQCRCMFSCSRTITRLGLWLRAIRVCVDPRAWAKDPQPAARSHRGHHYRSQGQPKRLLFHGSTQDCTSCAACAQTCACICPCQCLVWLIADVFT